MDYVYCWINNVTGDNHMTGFESYRGWTPVAEGYIYWAFGVHCTGIVFRMAFYARIQCFNKTN